MVLPRLPKQLAEKARYFACSLYKNVPGALVPNAGEDALRFVWDNLCDPNEPQDPPLPGLPPQPAPPVSGGQCICIAYNIRVHWTFDSSTAPGEQPASGFQDLQLFGKIGGSRVVSLSPNPDGSSRSNIQVLCQGQNGTVCAASQFWLTAVSQVSGIISHRIENRGRVDNGADNCGNLPEQFPPAPSPPPGGYTSPPTPITLNDNDTVNVTFNLVPPTSIIPAVKFPPVVIRVDSPTLKVPITFNFNAGINIGVPDGVSVDFGDIGDKIDDIDKKTDDINNKTDKLPEFFEDFDFIFNPPSFEDSPEVTKTPLPESEEGEKDQPDLLGALVTLTKLPDKVQFGEPNCYFAGWLTFKTQEGYSVRQQINFENSYFEAPLGANGVAYTFTNQSQGTVLLYSKKSEQE